MDGFIIWLDLNCWEYRVREACHDSLYGGVLHLVAFGGPECLFALLDKKRFGPGAKENGSLDA
jgi:hypothetical protein